MSEEAPRAYVGDGEPQEVAPECEGNWQAKSACPTKQQASLPHKTLTGGSACRTPAILLSSVYGGFIARAAARGGGDRWAGGRGQEHHCPAAGREAGLH